MQEFGKDKHMVHSGMLASAEWLRDRLYCVALVPLLAFLSILIRCCSCTPCELLRGAFEKQALDP